MSDNHPTSRWLAIVVAALAVQSTLAGGFYLTELGTPNSLGNAGAGNVTNNTGADTSFTNPAGMTGVDTMTMFSGLQAVLPKIEFESSIAEAGGGDGGNAGAVAAIPSFFMVKPLSEKARFGISAAAPLGGAFDFGSSWTGRYALTELALTALGVSPSFAYRVNDRVSLGVGASAIFTSFEMEIAVNAGPSPDGLAKIEEADDVGVQPFAGLQWKYSDSGVFGMVYRGKMEVKLEGDIQITGLPLPVTPQGDLNFGWDNPQLLEIGIRQRLSDRWTIMVNADWEDWSQFSDNVVAIDLTGAEPVVVALDRMWEDTYKVGVGAVRSKGTQRISFGAAYDSSPVEDEDRTLDLPSDEQLRLSFMWGRERGGKYDWGIGGTLLWLGDGKLDQTNQGFRTAGEFDSNWTLFLGGTIRRRSGGAAG